MQSEKQSLYGDLLHRLREENSNKQLNALPRDYYERIGEYIGELKRLLQETDQKSTRAILLSKELQQARKIARDLIAERRLKIIRFVTEGKILSKEEMTVEDEVLYSSILSAMNSFNEEIQRSVERKIEKSDETQEETPKRILVRFLREIPAIIGSDMRTYGPFKTEDIAALPAENTITLVKQGFAVKVEVPKDESP